MLRFLNPFALMLSALVALAACNPATVGQPSFDQQFIDMMVPHHQSAVEMAKIAQTRSQRPEIRQLASDIVSSQDSEISQLRMWRKSWFGSDTTPPMDRMPMVPGASMDMGGMQMSGGTMNMQADIDKLRQAGEPFDKAFIDAMIPHHQSAIDAAKAAQTRAQRNEIKTLAENIIRDQQREIDQMKQWRQAWFGSPNPGT